MESRRDHGDETQAYALGYLEGAMTVEGIWNSWLNFSPNGTKPYPLASAARNFITTNDAWIRSMAKSNDSDYWYQVSLLLAQFDGLFAGYNHYASESQKLAYTDFLIYQLVLDLGDIVAATTNSSAGVNIESHCSVLIKKSADGQRLFTSHVTWSGYSSMLRTFKHYNHPYARSTAASKVSFSSFPGMLVSGDDYYLTNQNMAIVETTNSIFNPSVYKWTTTKTIPYWIRVTVANRMSTNGKTWSDIFGSYNSGTYNNQWMVVDYKLFTPGESLRSNTLWVLEQIPGLVMSADLSATLEKDGYWGSYNVPYFKDIWVESGYPAYYQKYGNAYSWSECARAKIFRRDQHKVSTMEEMKSIMRYNRYQTDPLSLQDACRGVSARCDLNTPWAQNTLNGYSAFGGIDCKMTDNTKISTLQTQAVSGPSWESQPPFAWTEEWASVPHFGMPQVYDFDFVNMKPEFPSETQ
eukprot:TRINITY_DN1475_c0_g1_i1.p1 TRINITY_DN1475_c0_g1~~TRINITY_DN1475_c0_g1_i1.p1  ORF type:complete len:533 (+),score=102.06 TRINITY_DN1475_c0_g1_i1:202-1599(+)